MEWIAPIGIIISLGIIIYLAMKSYSILVIAPLCTLLVIITNRMDVVGALITNPNSFMAGMVGFILNMFFVFALGSILAKLLDDSGAAKSIGAGVLKITGTESSFKVLIAILVVGAILTYGGVSLFVAIFALVPLARPIFRETNTPWHLAVIPISIGMCTFTMSMLPGSPSVQNVIPSVALGTALTAAPWLGLVSAATVIIFGLWYMKRETNKAKESGEGYVITGADKVDIEDRELPSMGISLAPMVVLIGIIFAGSFMKVPNIILIALSTAIILAVILFNKYINNTVATINSGAINSVVPMMFTAAAVGFGGVVAAAPGFNVFGNLLMGIPGSPLISLSVTTAFFSFVTASSSGALGIVMKVFADGYLGMGVNPEALHRIAAIASGIGFMPHGGAIIATLSLMGLTHKEGYRHFLVTGAIGTVIALIPALILAILIY